jgi:tyrosine-protein kinase Etk/Wzc
MQNIEELISYIGSEEKKKNKNQILKYLRKWPWFVLFSAIGVVLGYFTYKNSPNTYEVTSRLLVKSDENSINPLEAESPNRSTFGGRSYIENQIGIMQSYTLYRKALSQLDWKYTWYKKNFFHKEDLYGNAPFELVIPPNGINSKHLPIEIEPVNANEYKLSCDGLSYINGNAEPVAIEKTIKYGVPFANEYFNFTINNISGSPGNTYELVFNDLDGITSYYLSMTDIGLEDPNSDIITVRIAGKVSPPRTVDFINELNDVIIEFGVENQFQTSEVSVEFIDSQLERLKQSLDSSAENFSTYRQRNQVVNLGQEAELVYSRLEEIEQDRYLTQLQVEYYEDLIQYIGNSRMMEEMVSPSVVGISDQSLIDMLKNLTDLYGRREKLSYTVQEKNPSYIILQNEIKVAQDGLEETVKNQMNATMQKLESLNNRYTEIQNRLKTLPETEKELVGIQREFDLNNELYTYMLQKKAEASISKASIAPKVQIIDRALLATTVQTGPDIFRFLAIGLMSGFMLPLLFFVLVSLFNNKIESIEEVENASKIPVFEGIVRHKYKTKLPVIKYPRSGIAECFRRVRHDINTMLEKPGSKVISINSLLPGEGKSFISSNLALIMAKSGHKILIIGADLHRPTLHHNLELKESVGLSDYLINKKDIKDIIFDTSFSNLYVIQAGTSLDSPSDALDFAKLAQLIDYVRTKFDYVIIDNAPSLIIPDSILFSQISDMSLFVLRMNKSHKAQIDQINKLVSFNKLITSALLLNDLTDLNFGYDYGYYRKYYKKGYKEYNYQ